MFVSFFPRPKLFFPSALAWTLAVIVSWYLGGATLGAEFGLGTTAFAAPRVIGIAVFWSKPFLWFYVYYTIAVLLFGGFWMIYMPHPWALWSIFGSAFIIFATYFQVEVSVAINIWYGPFFDLIQKALSRPFSVTAGQFYSMILTFAGIAFVAVAMVFLTRFFVSHYIFRWRTAMNDYYMARWSDIRHIEGASQRVQDDTMRFSTTLEGLGMDLINSIMTLIAFLPVLMRLSTHVNDLPLIGHIPNALVLVAVVWSMFGTGFLALVGIKLPGLFFRNQLVEAAYRKELVFGEDDFSRARPATVAEIFAQVRRNYFRIYFHYMYFNIARTFYLQANGIYAFIILAPSIVAARITFGVLQRILHAFDQVRTSLQYLVNSWTTIIELLSIYKRLRQLDAEIAGKPIPAMPSVETASHSSQGL